jgi:hypothetical protein
MVSGKPRHSLTGLVNVEIAQTALLMGLAVPEIMGKCFHIVFHYLPS